MTQRLLLLFILLFAVRTAWSVPADSKPFTVTNSDGTVLTIMLCGDECCHFYTTLDGTLVVEEENGDWRLAPELADSIQNAWSERSTRLNLHRQQRAIENKTRRAFGYNTSFMGKKKGIVILVEFPNKNMKSVNTREKFERMFNQEGYHENNHKGSVHDYFYDQSYGQLDLTFDVFGPISVSESDSYYGENNSKGNDQRVGELTTEVCKLADATYDINWADYDWDGDKEVDQVYIIYAGVGENAGGGKSTIWPHESSLTLAKPFRDGEGPIKLGGCTIDTYAMSNELKSSYDSTLCGIGTPCHEFSHCLGLPDFYDAKYTGGVGMQQWDLMASGSNNGISNNGECPPGFTAYERWFAGWLELTELHEPTTITDMPCLHDEPVAYIIYNEGHRDEYFILENRQSKGWYQYTKYYSGMHGLLVTHVDYKRDAWVLNTVNTVKDHQRMSFIPAGKDYGTANADQYRSQLFPGSKNVTELTNDSHEDYGGTLFHRNTDGSKYMNKPITDIQESDGLISFKFMGGAEVLDIQDITDTTQPIIYYTLDGIQVEKPTKSGIYIIQQGDQIRKFLVR